MLVIPVGWKDWVGVVYAVGCRVRRMTGLFFV